MALTHQEDPRRIEFTIPRQPCFSNAIPLTLFRAATLPRVTPIT